MKKNLLSYFLKFLIVLLISSVQSFAGVTGKIAGKVTDAQTGEELIGINVLVEGTTTGAATGIDGTY
ncbi:MAG TPA: carboxypeptidase-like regulatory domain-containing protein, partial [Ignavibacteriaceae bacterium]|nr:carboxypeptidase-like regulatory domain-containing protein [Ignavibacteriaceae bacterium]